MTKAELIQNTRKYDPNEPYIFISYDHKDRAAVWRDVCYLQKQNSKLNIWLDEKDINKRKKNWQTDVEEVLAHDNCRLLLFYLSKNSLQSKNCCRELRYITNRQDLEFLIIEAKPVPADDLKGLIEALLMETFDSSEMLTKKKIQNAESLFGFKQVFENEDCFDKSRVKYGDPDYHNEIIRNLPEIFDIQILSNAEYMAQQTVSTSAARVIQEIVYSDGSRYIGEVRGDRPHGMGKMYYANSYEYFGEWENGQKNGVGKLSYPSSSTRQTAFYFGEWKDDKKDGKGLSGYRDGTSVIDEWKNGSHPARTRKTE